VGVLILLAAASAAGVSADVELVHAGFTAGGLPGVDSPRMEPGAWRVGALMQYAQDPLILYEWDAEVGAVIQHRATAQVGLAYDFGARVSARVSAPGVVQWGSEVPELAPPGAGVGDIWGGLRVLALERRALALGLRGDVAVPTGTQEAWLGEPAPRSRLGALAEIGGGATRLMLDAGGLFRPQVDTETAFVLGSELAYGLGVRQEVWPARLDVGAALVGRAGLAYLFDGGAENATELLSWLALRPVGGVGLELGLGKGLADGYGTTALRALTALTWTRLPRPEPPAETILIPPPPLEVIITPGAPQPAEDPEDAWEEGQLARISGDEIQIREKIRFEVDTANILEGSLPVLTDVAALLNLHGEIDHLMIEGHASEEGSYTYNYDLSGERARSIYQALVLSGVHPDRMSYRSMGEVRPLVAGDDESAWTQNRRVVFHILVRLPPGVQPEPYDTDILLPWSGEPAKVQYATNPYEAPPPPPEEDDYSDDEYRDGFFEGDEGGEE